MKKRLLSVLMCLSMVLSLLPAVTLPAAAATTDRSVMLGSTALAIDGSGCLYYGRKAVGSPFLWRVLSDIPSDYKSYTDTNTKETFAQGSGYSLVSAINSFTTNTVFNPDTITDGVTYTYENSNLRTALKSFQETALSAAERSYLLPTTVVAAHTGGPSGADAAYGKTETTQQVVIPGEKVFEVGAALGGAQESGSQRYWLRDTTHQNMTLTEVDTAYCGSAATTPTTAAWGAGNADAYMRPSANLDAKIGLLTSPNGKPTIGAGLTATALYSDGKWVPTMTDSARTGFTASLSSATAGRNAEITIAYSGAYTSEQSGDLMVLLLQDGAVRQTARIATTSESGTATINTGSVVGGYEVKIFAESCPANDVAVMSNVADAGTLTVNVSTDTAVTDSVNAINAMTALTVTQAAFEGNQQQAVAEALNAWLLENVNEGASVAAADVAITNAAPAQAGSSGTPAGVNGEVTFTPTVTKSVSSKAADSLTWTVTATPYTGTTDADAVSQAETAVKALDFGTLQSEGNTEEELRALTAAKINTAIASRGVSVLTSQITTSTFTAATAGTSDAPVGTNGSFAFAVTLAKGSASQTVSGLTAKITATPYTAVGGLGTEASPYILTTATDLQLLAAYPGAHFKLGANIALPDAYWTPLGTFSGTLDGDGYGISGLKLGVTSQTGNQGFFTSLTSTATVKNLTFVSPQLPLDGVRGILNPYGERMSYTDGGGFLADSSAGKIENCRVENAAVNLMSDLGDSNSYDGAGGLEHFGGLVNINTGTVRNCAVDGITLIVPAYRTDNFKLYTISADRYPQVKAIGGMIGENSGTVSGCTVTGLYMPNPQLWCKYGGAPSIIDSTTLMIGFPNQSYTGIRPMLGIGGLIGYQDGACTSNKVNNLYVSCAMQTLGSSVTGSPYYLARDGFGSYAFVAESSGVSVSAYTTNGAVIGYVETPSTETYVSIPDTISAGVTGSAASAVDAHGGYLAGGHTYMSSSAEYSHSKAWDGTSSGTNTWTVVLKNSDSVLSSYSVTKGDSLTLPQTRLSDGSVVTQWKDANGTTTYNAGTTITVASDLTLTVNATAASGTLYAVDTTITDTTVAQSGTASSGGVAYAPIFSFTGTAPEASTYVLSYRLTNRDDLTWSDAAPTNAGVYDVKISPKDPSLWTATVYTVTGGLTLTGPVPAGRITIASANATRAFSNQAQNVTADQLDFDHTDIPAANISNIRYQSGTAAATDTAPTQPGTYTVLANIAAVAPFTATTDYSLGTLTILTAAQSALTKNVFLKYSNTAQQTVSIASLLPAGIVGASYYAGYPTYSDKAPTLFAVRPTCSAGVVSYKLAGGLAEDNVGQTATIPVTVTSSNYSQFTVNVVVSIADRDDCSDSIAFADGSKPYNGAGQTYEAATLSSGFVAGADAAWTYTYYNSNGTEVSSPVAAGTYTVKATYTDSLYTGSKTAKLTIAKADNALTNKTNGGYSATQTYGSVADPAVSQFSATYPITSISTEWYQDGKKLDSKPVNVGPYTARVTAAATENANAASVDITFNITQAALTVKANDQSIPYAGSLSQTPSNVTAAGLVNGDTVGSVTLSTANTGVTTSGTITPSAAVIKNGDTDVTANYAITYATGKLTITKSAPTISISADYTGKTYDGTAMADPTAAQLTVTGAPASEATFTWYDSTGNNVTTSAPTSAGTYKVKASIPATDNHGAAVSGFKDFTIAAKQITPTVTLSQDSYTYQNGAEIEPTVTVKDDATTLQAADYTVTYGNNKNVGTAIVTVTAKAGGNYSFDAVTKEFTINPTAATGLTISTDGTSYTYWYNRYITVTVSGYSSTLNGTTATLYYGNTATVLATASWTGSNYILKYDTTKKKVPVGENQQLTVKITGNNISEITLKTSVTLKKDPIGVKQDTLIPQSRSYSKGNVNVSLSGTPTLTTPFTDDEVNLVTTGIVGTMADDSAGTNKTVTFTGFALTGSAAGFYEPYETSIEKTVTITKASVTPTVELSANSFAYNGSAQTPTVTVKDGDTTISADEYNVTYSGDTTNVGGKTVTVSAKSTGNYTFSDITATYDITNATQSALTITHDDGTSVKASGDTYQYGKDIFLASTGGAGTGSGSLSVVDGNDHASASGGRITFSGLGPVTVRMTKTVANYNDVTADYTFTVVQGTPTVGTVTRMGSGNVYTNTAISAITLSGSAANGNNVAVDGTIALAEGQTLKAGTNDYTCVFKPTDSAHYTRATGTVSLKVLPLTPATLSVSGLPMSSCTFGDRFSTEGLKFTVTYAGDTTAEIPADQIKITYANADYNYFYDIGHENVTLSYTENEVTASVTYNVTVNKKSIDVSGIGLSKTSFVFDGRQKTVTLDRPVPEGVNITSMTGTSATDASDNKYTAVITFALADGYTDKYSISGVDSNNKKSLDWSINKASAPQISEQSASYLYSAATSGNTFDFASLLPADRGTTTYAVTSTTYTGLDNVAINAGTGALTYDTKALSAAATDTVTDTVTVTATMQNYSTATITLKVDLTDKIPVAVDLSGDALSDKPYDGTALSYTGTASGTYTGGTYNKGFTYEWYQGTAKLTAAPKDAGTYTLKAAVADSAYTGSAQKTVTISPRTASLTWAGTAFTYDGTAKTPTATVSNAVSGDSVTVTVTGGQTHAGKYRATAASLSNANYQLPEVNTVSYTINKAESSIALTPVTATYGSQATFTVTAPADATGTVLFYGNGTLLGQANFSGGSASINYNIVGGPFTAGSNTITAAYAGDNNYNAATASATFTLAPKSIAGAAIDAIADQTFTGSPVTPAVTVKDGSATLVSGTDYTVSYSSNTNAGTATVTVSGTGHYTGTVQKAFTITPKASGSANAAVSVVYSDTAAKTVSLADVLKAFKAGSETLTFSNVQYAGSDLAAAPTVDAGGVLSFALKSGLKSGGTTETVTVDVAGLTNYTKVTVTVTISLTNPAPAGGSSTDTGTKVTIPVSSNEGDVKVEATVKDGTAAVTITDAQIAEIASGKSDTGTVKMDVSSLDVSAATVPAKVIAAADSSASATGVEVALPTGTVTLDKTALAAVSEKGGDVTISVDKVDNAKLTETQKEVLGSQAETALVVDVTVLASGQKVSAFNGGSVGVAVPYTPKANEDTSKLVVWFVKDDGSIEPKTGFYNARTGKFEFKTEHLSQYVLVSFPFRDVAADSWYYGNVAYAYMNGLFAGTGETTFSPAETMTRGMLVTVLYRMEDGPAVTAGSSFTDVAADAYYAKAVAWASANKLVTGYDAATFAPDDTVTREQLAAVLCRYAQFKGYDVSKTAELTAFADASSASAWATDALRWATGAGLINGSDGKLLPQNGAQRAQVAAILQRYVRNAA